MLPMKVEADSSVYDVTDSMVEARTVASITALTTVLSAHNYAFSYTISTFQQRSDVNRERADSS